MFFGVEGFTSLRRLSRFFRFVFVIGLEVLVRIKFQLELREYLDFGEYGQVECRISLAGMGKAWSCGVEEFVKYVSFLEGELCLFFYLLDVGVNVIVRY